MPFAVSLRSGLLNHDVFISYSHQDQATAQTVCRGLEARGIRCWIAPRDILGGQDYAEAVVDAVGAARAFVLVFSKHANESAHVRRELERAVNERKPIVPIRTEDVPLSKALQYLVGTHQWLDLSAASSDRELGGLARSIEALLGLPGDASKRPPKPDAVDVPSFVRMATGPECLVGREIGSYILRSPLGVGGSGAAYAAWDTRLGRKVCVKILHPAATAVARFRGAVGRAVRALASLEHANVVEVFGSGDVTLADGTSLYIAMELVDGPSLDAWSRGLSEDIIRKRLDAALTLSGALAAAHTCRYVDEVGFEQIGILHGDIKPSNVLVRNDGSPVLLDFLMIDVRRLQDPRIVPEHEVPVTAACGTPGFMAPEQAADGLVTVRSDVYGLGVTLCHLFYSDQAEPLRALYEETATNEPLPGLTALLRRMTQARPAARPASMAEVVAELEKIRGAARGSALSRRLTRWWRELGRS